MLNRVRVDTFIESGFFERGADDNSSIAAWHEVNLRRANDVTHNVVLNARHCQHLSFDRTSRDVMRRETPRPRSRTIHDAGRAVMGSIGLDSSYSPIGEKQIGRGSARRNIHSAMFRRL